MKITPQPEIEDISTTEHRWSRFINKRCAHTNLVIMKLINKGTSELCTIQHQNNPEPTRKATRLLLPPCQVNFLLSAILRLLANKASADTNNNPPPPTLQTLPVELQLRIFKSLDPIASTCAGLSCKALYPIHIDVHGIVKLDHEVLGGCYRAWARSMLYQFLWLWGGEVTWSYDLTTKSWRCRFIGKE